MSGGVHKPAKKRFKAEEAALRSILHRWQPIPGAPEDEYDCLVHHLLSHLHAHPRSGPEEIAACISEQMAEHFRSCGSVEGAKAVSRKIHEAWKRFAENV